MEERKPRFEIWSTPRQPYRWSAYLRMIQEELEESIQNGFNCETSTNMTADSSNDVDIQANFRPRPLSEQQAELINNAVRYSDIYGVYGSSWASHDIGWTFKEEKKISTINH